MAFNDLVKITANGLVFPSFAEIRSAIIENYKTTYGTDIDLSTGSADGVFVYNLALLMNSQITALRNMYNNMNIQTAGGVYLDALCALSNVRRQEATRSNTTLTIANVGQASITITPDTKFVSDDGTTWSSQETVTIASNTSVEIQVFCDELGPIEAPAGSITKTIENLSLAIAQGSAALIGLTLEDDDHLRARQLQSSGAYSSTVLQGLVGSLLSQTGIRDALVYNNASSSSLAAADGTTIPAHAIYAVIRRYPGINVPDSAIAKIIYNKLTPGIVTTPSTGSNGTAKSFAVIPEMLGIQLPSGTETIYWKEAEEIADSFEIQITPNSYFVDPSNSSPTTSEYATICPKIMNWLNSQTLGKNLTSNDVQQFCMSVDPKKFGRRTFTIGTSSVGSSTVDAFTNPDSFYQYSSYAVTSTTLPGTYTITFS